MEQNDNKYLRKGIAYLESDDYENAIYNLIMALRQGITKEEIEELQHLSDKTVFQVFKHVAIIFNELKVKPKEKLYLSHITRLSVATKLLTNLHKEEEKGKSQFRMYHIAYANDPTEGTVLFEQLGEPIQESPSEKIQSEEMPYVMVASFCGAINLEELDSLPMWNMYGKDATGIALFFQAEDIAVDNQRQAIPLPTLSIKSSTPFLTPQQNGAILPTKETEPKKANTEDEASPEQLVEPILYKVHYIDRNSDQAKKQNKNEELQNTDKIIKDSLDEIRDNLEKIKKQSEYSKAIQDSLGKIKENLEGIKEQSDNSKAIQDSLDEIKNMEKIKEQNKGQELQGIDKIIQDNFEDIKNNLEKIKEQNEKQELQGTDKMIQKSLDKIEENLKKIKGHDIYNKALEMLDGVRYLIKSTKYQHENEYRLLYFANEDEIPERLKYEEGVHDNFSKPGIYVETNILTELCGIMTAPRVSETQVLEMQYLLQWGKKKLDKLEDNYIHKSKIPYRASRTQ